MILQRLLLAKQLLCDIHTSIIDPWRRLMTGVAGLMMMSNDPMKFNPVLCSVQWPAFDYFWRGDTMAMIF